MNISERENCEMRLILFEGCPLPDPLVPPYSYLGVAFALDPAVERLHSSAKGAYGQALLAAHMVECLLKAFISKANSSVEEIQGHDLVQLWNRAAALGLPFEREAPAWVHQYAAIHGRPYILRYASGKAAVWFPKSKVLKQHLTPLLTTVYAFVMDRDLSDYVRV